MNDNLRCPKCEHQDDQSLRDIITQILAGGDLTKTLDDVLEACRDETLVGVQYCKKRLEIYGNLADKIIDRIAEASCGCVYPAHKNQPSENDNG